MQTDRRSLVPATRGPRAAAAPPGRRTAWPTARVALPRALGAAAFSLLAGCATTVVSLDGPGGDVWTFAPRLTGHAGSGCAEVWVASSRGQVLADRDGDAFAAVVPLAAGENDVTAICVRAGGSRVSSAAQPWRVRLEDRPTARVRVRIGDDGVVFDAGASTPSEAGAVAITGYSWSVRAGNPEGLLDARTGAPVDAIPGDTLTVTPPATDGAYYVRLTITDAAGHTDTSVATFDVSYGEPLTVDLATEHPAWVDTAVVYGVVPFFFGGGFADVTARLDALEALGVTVLWLSPVMACPDDDFGYAVTDPFELRDTFGDSDSFRALIDGAHARGMKVILDFVANHTSDQHPYFKAQARDGTLSPYYDWYDRDTNGDVTSYYGWTNLPNLDYDNPEVQRYITEAFSTWIRRYDVDGFRADAAWGVESRAPEFWPALRAELQRIKPDVLLLAEGTARDPYWFSNGFDAAYDWTWEPGEWAWQSAFDADPTSVYDLEDALDDDGEGFDPNALVFRFLDNNDTGARFVTRYGVERVPAAAALLLTAPGLPALFTGDEVGAAYEPYDEGPAIDWDDPDGLTPIYTRLIRLRTDLAALHSPDWELFDLGPNVLGYVRIAPDPAENVVVLLNFSHLDATVALPDADAVAPVVAGGSVQDLYEDTTFTLDPADPRIAIRGYGVRILANPAL